MNESDFQIFDYLIIFYESISRSRAALVKLNLIRVLELKLACDYAPSITYAPDRGIIYTHDAKVAYSKYSLNTFSCKKHERKFMVLPTPTAHALPLRTAT